MDTSHITERHRMIPMEWQKKPGYRCWNVPFERSSQAFNICHIHQPAAGINHPEWDICQPLWCSDKNRSCWMSAGPIEFSPSRWNGGFEAQWWIQQSNRHLSFSRPNVWRLLLWFKQISPHKTPAKQPMAKHSTNLWEVLQQNRSLEVFKQCTWSLNTPALDLSRGRRIPRRGRNHAHGGVTLFRSQPVGNLRSERRPPERYLTPMEHERWGPKVGV